MSRNPIAPFSHSPQDIPGSAMPTGQSGRKGSVGLVLLVIFLDLLGFGIVLPMLPYIAAQYETPPWMTEAFGFMGVRGGEGAIIIGVLSFAFSFFQFVCAPLWGRLSDHVGRKPVLSVSMFGYTGAWALFALAPSLEWLIISRALAGIFAANIATAQAYIADVYPPEKRSRGMGLVGAAFGLGFTLGPALGAGLIALTDTLAPDADAALRLRVPIWTSMGLSFLAFLGATALLPESLPPELRGRTRAHGQGRLATLVQALRGPIIGPLLLSWFTATFGFAVLETMFGEFNRAERALSEKANALAFSIIGVVIVLVQGGLIHRLTKRFGPWRLVIAGMLLEGGALATFGYALGFGPMIALSVVLAFGNSILNPSLLALISLHSRADQQGGMMGVASSSSALGRILGPLAGAAVWSWIGGAAAFATAGVIVALALPLVLRAKKRDGSGKPKEAVVLSSP